MNRVSSIVFVASIVIAPALGLTQDINAMIPVKSHQFGTVAVASKTEYRFFINNNSNNTLHIQTVRASCGCTTPIVETPYIAPGQSGSILARFNTDTFRGKRGATLTVVFDKPYFTEVRLTVDGYIRQDMVFHPGAIDFGKRAQGQEHSQSAKIMYAGRDDWSVVEVLATKPWMQVDVKQESRAAQRANYVITVKLDASAPAGYFQDEVIVVTNDRNMPRVPLRVSGDLESELAISPQTVAIGAIKPGESVSRQLVVRGREPFLVESIKAAGFDVTFAAPTEAKATHIFSATFTPNGNNVGPQSGALVITTTGTSSRSAQAMVTADVRSK